MKRIPLIMSLIFNILLVMAIFGVRLHYHRIIFQTLYDVTTSEVSFHESILAELRSNDTYKIETVKTVLENNIKDRKEAAVAWKSAVERNRMR